MGIPFPNLKSYLHERIEFKPLSQTEVLERFSKTDPVLKIVESMLSRVFRKLQILQGNRKWVLYRIIMTPIHYYFKYFRKNQLLNTKNIPSEGAIFIVNHIAGQDVVVPFLAGFRKPVGVFTDMGDGLIVDIAERIGIVPRRGNAPEMVEKMIRTILLTNRYFVMWPEGTPDKGRGVMQGFSSIIKVYATLNADSNRIPFVPVVMQEYYYRKNGKITLANKLSIDFLESVYFPRDWLNPPNEGGKTPREMIDYLMLKIASKFGQSQLAPNPVLERRRQNYDDRWH